MIFVILSLLSLNVTFTGNLKAGPSSSALASETEISAGEPSEYTITSKVNGVWLIATSPLANTIEFTEKETLPSKLSGVISFKFSLAFKEGTVNTKLEVSPLIIFGTKTLSPFTNWNFPICSFKIEFLSIPLISNLIDEISLEFKLLPSLLLKTSYDPLELTLNNCAPPPEAMSS